MYLLRLLPSQGAFHFGLLLAGLLVLFQVPKAPGQTRYEVKDLGTLGGTSSFGTGINSNGMVVGVATTAGGQSHAFLVTNAASPMVDLGTLGGDSSAAFGINGSGVVVGVAFTADEIGRPFFYDGQLHDLSPVVGGTNGIAGAINDRGQLVGLAGELGAGERGFILDQGTVSYLTHRFAYGTNQLNSPQAINASGVVVGAAYVTMPGEVSVFRAFRQLNGTMTDLGTFVGVTASTNADSFANGINDAGAVVGRAQDASTGGRFRAYVQTVGPLLNLGVLGGAVSESEAVGINNRGQIVGHSGTASGRTHAFVYQNGVMADLNDLIPTNSGWELVFAGAINERGQIVCTGNIGSAQRAVLLTPVTGRVELVGFEVNQAVQDWNNSVPLIAGKATLVRAHFQSRETNALLVRGQLHGYAGGSAVELPNSPLAAFDAFAVAETNLVAYGEEGSNSLRFQLPTNWLTGALKLHLEVTSVGGIADSNVVCSAPGARGESNGCSLLVSFLPSPILKVFLVGIRWTNIDDAVYDMTRADLIELRSQLTAIFPVAQVDIKGTRKTARGQGPPRLGSVNEKLLLGRANAQSDRLYFGALRAVPGVTTEGGQANALGTGVVASGYFSVDPFARSRNRHAHELGHLLGLHHTVDQALFGTAVHADGTVDALGPCRERADTNAPAYPYFAATSASGGRLVSTFGPIAGDRNQLLYGYDHDAHLLVNATEHFELMSYCGSWRWISKLNYTNLIALISARFGTNRVAPSSGPRVGNQDHLLVRGTIDTATDQVAFAPFSTMTGVASPVPPGSYTAQFLDQAGTVVASVPFAPLLGVADEPELADTVANFLVTTPANPLINRVVLRHTNTVIATRIASANRPAVAILFPNAGETLANATPTFTWRGTDLDGDVLTYLVEFSADGGATWDTLAEDWPDPNFPVLPETLPGTVRGLLRVTASDGFNTGVGVAAAFFTVPNSPPVVSVVSPGAGAVFGQTQQLVFQAATDDLEDGVLADGSLLWRSSLDGVLGSGNVLLKNAASLSVGHHLISVTATDSHGVTNRATVNILIGKNTQPRIHRLGNAPANLRLIGDPQATQVIQFSSNLTNWFPLFTNTPPTGIFEYADPAATNATKRFYRAIVP